MAGILDDGQSQGGGNGLLDWIQTPQASAFIQGLLSQATPSMTQPRSFAGALSAGMAGIDQANTQAYNQKFDQQKLGFEKQRLGLEGARVGMERERLNNYLDEAGAYKDQQAAQQKIMQQLFATQPSVQPAPGQDASPASPAAPDASPATPSTPAALSGALGNTMVGGGDAPIKYDDLSNQSPAQQPPAQPPQASSTGSTLITLGNGLKVTPEQYKRAQLLYAMGDSKGAMKLLTESHSQNLTGLPQEYASLAQLGEQYGKDSDIYKNAKAEIDQRRQAKSQLMDYRQKLTDTADKRFSTQLGKMQAEKDDVEAGFLPGTGRTVEIQNPEMQQSLLDTYGLAQQKLTTDSDTRRRSLFASNIDKTIQRIDPTALMQYGGLIGSVEKAGQQALASSGNESANYDKYSKSLQAAQLLAHQVRQFYGESIQPVMNAKIEKLVNPADWKTNPKLAQQNYQEIVDILHNETGTFRGGLRSTREFEAQGAPQMSRENLEYTAQKHGMSVDDVIKKLKGGK